MVAVVLLSASGVAISAGSLARYMHAAHSSVRGLVSPAIRLLALVVSCLLPAAVALHSGRERLALAAGAGAIAVYYLILLRSNAGSRILLPTAERQPGSP
jgi:hypothetical protein